VGSCTTIAEFLARARRFSRSFGQFGHSAISFGCAYAAMGKNRASTTAGGLLRLCRLLCGKPAAFRQAAEPECFRVVFFSQTGPERQSLSAQQAAEPRFFTPSGALG
jgi:hypothetical protein